MEPGTGSSVTRKQAVGSSDAVQAQYLRLQEEIFSGALPPGSPVLETVISTRYGVGRAPVREAILRLESDGLLHRGPRGVEVRVRSIEEVAEIYQARIALEAEAAAQAARVRSPLDLERLRHVQERASSASDPAEARALHARWHIVLAQASRNTTIAELLERLAWQLAPYETASLADSPNLNATDGEHPVILDAISSGDVDAARSLLTTHLERTRDVRIAALVRAE
ncbi:MAG: transcriptional regulator, GntR family [Sphaerisporangium sp.]|nr:transcriptional regulator, GntR family [Sphaerisporangium sp.]